MMLVEHTKKLQVSEGYQRVKSLVLAQFPVDFGTGPEAVSSALQRVTHRNGRVLPPAHPVPTANGLAL